MVGFAFCFCFFISSSIQAVNGMVNTNALIPLAIAWQIIPDQKNCIASGCFCKGSSSLSNHRIIRCCIRHHSRQPVVAHTSIALQHGGYG